MNRIIKLIILLLAMLLPVTATADGNNLYESCSSSITVTNNNIISFADSNVKELCVQNWDSNDDGELSISEAEVVTSIGRIFSYKSNIKSFNELVYFTGITSINSSTFSNCSSLTSITIPSGVTSIGDYAFSYCSSLTSITIPSGVTSIGDYAFSYCSSLTSITIPSGVTSIGNFAFNNCYRLTSISIPSGVTSIGKFAFNNCYRLTSITIPSGVTSIGDYAFSHCSSLTSISVSASNTVFDSRDNCNAIIRKSTNELIVGCKNTVISYSVTRIGDSAFMGSTGLTGITFHNSVTTIGNSAFYGCTGLTSITIPESVSSIGNDAFTSCTALNTLNFNAVACSDFSYNNRPFNSLNISTINFGNGVQRIPAYFADGLAKLTSITIPNSVTEIGHYAFRGCTGLTSITIPESVSSIGNDAFTGCTALNTLNFNAVACRDFSYSSPFKNLNISTIDFGNSVQRIPAYFADGLAKLTSITIPNSVTEIGHSAFRGCTGLTGITFPNSVTTIGNYAFTGCTALNILNFNAVACRDFDYYSPFKSLNISTINFGNSVQRIPAYFADGLAKLTSISIPNSVTEIGNSAFRGCTGLNGISIPESVSSIGNDAFTGCIGLTDVIVDKANLKYDSRDNCNAIIETASNRLFFGCKTTIIPNTITAIRDSAFYNCTGLTNINIPSSVTSIGNYAFWGCTGMNEVHSYIASPSLISMGRDAFQLSSSEYLNRALYVPEGAVLSYQTDTNWSPYFGAIVEEGTTPVFSQTFEVGEFQYSITSDSTVTVTKYLSNSNYNNIEVPYSVTYQNVNYIVTAIGDWGFYNKNIISVTLPESIASIGYAAFKECRSLFSLTMNALTAPFMHDSFDQHEKPTSSVIGGIILYVYKAAYTSYKSINDEYHFFSLISCIDGEATAPPVFEVESDGQPVNNGGESGAYSCTITIKGEEDSYIFDINYSHEGWLENNIFYCYNYYECMPVWYSLEARAISEGKRPSEIKEISGELRPRWYESFEFEDSGIYYNQWGDVTHCTYHNPCDNGGQKSASKTQSNHLRNSNEISTNDKLSYTYFDYFDDDYNQHYYYSGDVVIPETVYHNNTTYHVAKIGEYAFKDCVNLTSVTIPESIGLIDWYAFAGSSIKTIDLKCVEDICDAAFEDCKELSCVNISCNPEIGNYAFYGCTGLKRVNITNLESWFNTHFRTEFSNPLYYAHHIYLNDSEVTDLKIPNTVKYIYANVFINCSGLIRVTIPNTVFHIDDCAFYGCSNITDLSIGSSVDYITLDAFYGCRGLTTIKCHGAVPPKIEYLWEKKSTFGLNLEKSQRGVETEHFGGDTCFEESVYQNAILYVPMDAVDAYKNADGWKYFQHIVGFYDYDFEVDGAYFKITNDGEVVVARDDDAYQGVISIPETVIYEGTTYNVTGISSDAFAGATLQSLILPVTISSIDSTAFTNCHIHSLIITGNGSWTAGAIASEIDNLYVMSTVTGIEGLQVNPTTIYSYATNPSTCNDNTFTGYDGELHVPASSLAAYFTAPYWSNFINITGDAVEPTEITFNKDSISVLVGNQMNLNATVTPSNATPKDIFWTTSDGQIATVTHGVVTGIKAGECDIKAFLLDKSTTCHVTVTEILPTEVTLNQEFAKLEIGSQLALTATVLPDNATDKHVTWSTTNSAIATVDSLGNVTAVGQGECFITATCRDNQAMCHVIVVDHFIYITLDEHNVRLLPNHIITLTPTVSPANTSLVVTSSDPTVAAARMANGKIQVVGIKEGSTLITVNSTDGYAEVDSCIVKVYTLRGDVNSDGFINISDVTSLISRLLSGPDSSVSEENADTNNDGKISIADVTTLIDSLLSGEPLAPKEEPIDGALTFTVNGVAFTMIGVDGGTFTMGATPEQGDDALDGEKPAHQVTLSSYAIGQTEVTQALWVAVMGSNPSRFSGRLENPVEGVTWNDCQEFITQLNALTGKNFRLPTEAEWEFAARGGNKSQGYKYAGSNDINEVAWYTDNSTSTQPVATKKANELGIYDMSGNVWEWCQDYYGDYSSEPQTNPTGPETGTTRIRRGVGWNGSQLNGRVSHRSSREETYKYNSLGLRLAL